MRPRSALSEAKLRRKVAHLATLNPRCDYDLSEWRASIAARPKWAAGGNTARRHTAPPAAPRAPRLLYGLARQARAIPLQ